MVRLFNEAKRARRNIKSSRLLVEDGPLTLAEVATAPLPAVGGRRRTSRRANCQDPGGSGRLGRPGATCPCPGHTGQRQPRHQSSLWQTLGGTLLPLATG